MKTQKQIFRRRVILDKREDKIADDIITLQSECTHPDALKKHCSNTGNYDPSADSYWTEYKCPDCWKFWMRNGSQ